MDVEQSCRQAAEAVLAADALLIGAGAGMGVDSGLPDFRGPEGFWRAYPAFHGKRFAEISNPVWFQRDPEQAWGFFGHRLHLYRGTLPHSGFEILRRWGESRPLGYFVYTSNVDGHFQQAGFSPRRIVECHGSIHFLQCVDGCTDAIWPADETTVQVDADTVRAQGPLPQCGRCGKLARPNILMFGDGGWIAKRSQEQESRYHQWLRQVSGKRLAVVEFGAGTGVPTVRLECEERAERLIRVNPRDTSAPPGSIVLPMAALQAIQMMNRVIGLSRCDTDTQADRLQA
jgi:NAD-dependent SIR2 family protein deacetylase